jgi:hypothetical protein
MVAKTKNLFKLSEEDSKRQKRIISKLNLKKLPYKISSNSLSNLTVAMVRHSRSVLRYQEDKLGIKWCFSSIKKLKVFLVIFEANELGEEIYKEKISSKLPEYSYKTIAQIIDDGMKKGYYLQMVPRAKKQTDLKIRNIRLSEDIIVGFINWKIDMLSSLIEFKKKI